MVAHPVPLTRSPEAPLLVTAAPRSGDDDGVGRKTLIAG
jgi:hypothetical protein